MRFPPKFGDLVNTTSPTLLERLKSHEDGAWNWFVDLYTPLLYTWAKRCCTDHSDAADLVQETLVTLLQTIPHFERQRKGSFRRWLHVLLLNKQRDYYRRQQIHQHALAQRPTPESSPDVAVIISEQEYGQVLSQQALRLLQAEFEPSTWQAGWATLVQGRDVAEVARELGISANAVYVAKCRVIRRLREVLAGLLDD